VIKNLSSVSRNKSSVFLLVFALIVGGVGAQATGLLNTSSGGYLLCVNSKTKVTTHPGTTNCPKGSKKLTIGASGKDGKTLWNGEKDPENTLGSPGDIFINSVTKTLFGPKNLDGTWPAGVSMIGPTGATGPQGPGGGGSAGATGATGATGASGVKITELSVCDGPDAGTVANELCKIGMTGPGGGTIFFVDYYDQYASFDYLEAAPSLCEATRTWSSVEDSVPEVEGWAARAVGAGETNTAAIKVFFSEDTSLNNAAHYATACSAGSKNDWFLGSLGEMKLMYDNLLGLDYFEDFPYWSSSELSVDDAWYQYIDYVVYDPSTNFLKTTPYYVRPVRAF
jgi:hypothetical protein